jgi:hypothetical protein
MIEQSDEIPALLSKGLSTKKGQAFVGPALY